MKIAHVNFTFRQGGIPALLVDITNEQVRNEEVCIIVINNQVHKEMLAELNKKVQINEINRPAGSKNPYYILKINFLLARFKPDVIHCHGENCMKYLLPMYRKKAVITVHDTMVKSSILLKYKKVFAISKTVKQYLLNMFKLQSKVVYNGINVRNVKTKIKNTESNIFRIVQIGRLVTSIKGQHLSIEAIKKIVFEENITNIHIDFIGWGEDYEQLHGMVQQYKLEKYISFLGLKDRPYIYSHLCDYDLMIHPSLFEGFGLNIAEAMIAKIPVLVSDTEGPMEVIDNGRYGYFFKTGDINDLTEKLKNVINTYDKDIQNKQFEEACTHVMKTFDIKITAKNYVTEYKS